MSDHVTATERPATDFRVLWAKSEPRHPLWKHLLDAAAVSLALPAPCANLGWGADVTALLVGLHDIGKADAYFQHQVNDFSASLEQAGFNKTCDPPCRHERISFEFIRGKLKGQKLDRFTADAVSRLLVIHHGYWNEPGRSVSKNYSDAQDQLWDLLRKLLSVDAFHPLKPDSDISAFGMRLAGHIVLCDWIASNENFFTDARLRGVEDPDSYFAMSRSVAREWVSKLGFQRDISPGKAVAVVEATRPIQQMLLDVGAITHAICLAAPSYGLATCIEDQAVLFPEVIRRATDMPASKRIVIAVAIGYPDWDFPANRLTSRREPLENFTTWYGFD